MNIMNQKIADQYNHTPEDKAYSWGSKEKIPKDGNRTNGL
ncbi:hypothetical protein M2372_000832 [Chryseobacterium sp. BIGb0232]|nr:hypothetical protein [Chryseobacterium sp. BIGb0232]